MHNAGRQALRLSSWGSPQAPDSSAQCGERAHRLSSLGSEVEGGRRASRGAKKVPRLPTMRSQAGGARQSSIRSLKKATCAAQGLASFTKGLKHIQELAEFHARHPTFQQQKVAIMETSISLKAPMRRLALTCRSTLET
jgi:hypothetical protein